MPSIETPKVANAKHKLSKIKDDVCRKCGGHERIIGPCPDGRNCMVAHWIDCPVCTKKFDADEENALTLEGKLVSLLSTTMAIDEKRNRGIVVLVLSPEWKPGKAQASAERMMRFFSDTRPQDVESGAIKYKKYPFPVITVQFTGHIFPAEMWFRDYEQFFRPDGSKTLHRKHADVIWIFDR